MCPRLSHVIANATIFLAVPLGLAVAFLGYRTDLYPYAAVPFVAVGAVLGLLVVLFGLFPSLVRREAERD